MNTGIQDACNLAWKLALVVAGHARDELLDSYDAERRPIAAATIQNTDVATRVVTLRNPVAREVRNRLAGLLHAIEAVQHRMLRTATQIALHYRKSPIVREDRLAVVHASVTEDRSTEAPTLGDWLDFGAAAKAGDRAPDCVLGETRPSRLHELLAEAGTRHTLLLFDGSAATAAGYRTLASIARVVRERWGAKGLVDVHVVVPRAARPRELEWDGSVILDPEGVLHHRYGAGAECLYLIRPDGYVGYRSQPANEARLVSYLESIFV
jgi:hypothetical protein